MRASIYTEAQCSTIIIILRSVLEAGQDLLSFLLCGLWTFYSHQLIVCTEIYWIFLYNWAAWSFKWCIETSKEDLFLFCWGRIQTIKQGRIVSLSAQYILFNNEEDIQKHVFYIIIILRKFGLSLIKRGSTFFREAWKFPRWALFNF